jgi:hypothetical protein
MRDFDSKVLSIISSILVGVGLLGVPINLSLAAIATQIENPGYFDTYRFLTFAGYSVGLALGAATVRVLIAVEANTRRRE